MFLSSISFSTTSILIKKKSESDKKKRSNGEMLLGFLWILAYEKLKKIDGVKIPLFLI
jgi:hypothetical protein